MINFASLYGLGNKLNTTNFDGVTQPYFSSYVDGYPEYTYNMAQAMQNPYSSLWSNPLMLGTNLSGCDSRQQLQAQAGIEAAGQAGFSDGLKIRLSGYAANLNNLESQIQGLIDSGRLNDAQKSKMETILNRIKTIKQQIANLCNGKTIAAKDVEAVQKSITELTKSAEEKIQEIAKEVQEAEAAKEDGEKADGTGNSEGSDSAKETKEKTAQEKAAEKAAMVKITDDIDGYIRGAGTKYEELKTALTEKINKDNVLQLFETWNTNKKGKAPYNDGDDSKYGLIGSLMNDCEGEEKETIAKILITALEAKAIELGIDVSSEVSAALDATKSTGDWKAGFGLWGWRDDDKICQAVNALYEKVKTESAKVEAKQRVEADNAKRKEANEKAKAEQKTKAEAAKKETDAKNQFKDDLREIVGDDKAEISDKVEYKDGQFKVRVKGKDYYGSDYRELAEALKAAGYNPEQYLKKPAVKKAA